MEAYTRPYYPRRPLICLDEISKQLVGEVRSPLPLRPGQPARYDAEYTRKGVCNLFLLYEPLVRYREVRVTNRRTRLDWAQAIKDLVDVQYPEAERIVLVTDQLNTHHSASLYEAFPPAEAKRLADKLEIHYTPKHGTWLNMAEIELSVLSRQCLDQRIEDEAIWCEDVQAWVGNLTSLTETILGSGTAAYDGQDRLTACTWTGSESFGYPPIDNLTALDGTSISYGSPPGTPAHGPLIVGANPSYAYDQGYPTSDGVRSYTHDAERRLTSISQGGQTILSFVYDFDNKRLKRTANGVTTVYVGERYEINVATGQTTAYYPWDGTPVPMRQGSSLYLLHTDNLGSISRATDGSGANVAIARYAAYGALLTSKSSGPMPTDRGFTGQIRDGSASGWELYFFRSRYYNAATGRFLEPDTVVPDPKNPQALNRFSYALNNPLKLVDPSGHEGMDPNWASRFSDENHRRPTEQDWANYQFSLSHPGSGPGGSWTSADWSLYSQIQRSGSFLAGRQGGYLALSPPDVQRLENDAPWWIWALNFLPPAHGGILYGSLDDSRHGSTETVRILLNASPDERGVSFNPKFTLWVRSGSGQILGIPGALARYNRSTIGPAGQQYAQVFTAEFSYSGASVYGVSVFANPSVDNAIVGSGEVDVGFGPP